MFRGPLEEQARKLGHILTVVVKALSRPEQILGAVQELGRRHANYGVRPEHYDMGGTALLWVLETGLGEAFTAEVREAWTSPKKGTYEWSLINREAGKLGLSWLH